MLKDVVTDEQPLVGIEPSAMLAFRDEYPEIARQQHSRMLQELIARNAFLFEEFICREIDRGNITPGSVYRPTP
ncbi:MAG: hypothetical protein MZV63_20750 [Marinilabiliales bacterium]|nr:hypothetical protein [Marinilabiliales bacterium]